MSNIYHVLLMIAPLWGQHPMEVQIIPLRELYPNKVQFWRQLPAEQRTAAERIEALGGFVSVDLDADKPTAESISFKGDNFTDAQIPLLNPFKNTPLRGLSFVRTRLTEQGIAEALVVFKNVKGLTIFEMPVGDKAIAPLADFKDLEYVALSNTGISSEGIRPLREQPNLWSLDIAETQIDDSCLKHLEHLPALKSLFIGQTRITTVGLKSIGKVVTLESLLLNDTRVGDEGLAALADLQKLQTLRLDGSDVTNEGMAHVAKLTSLKDLYLERTKVDERGLALLQNMPSLREVRWMDPDEMLTKATPEQRRFFAKFTLYLPGNMDRWKDIRNRLESGEISLDQLAVPQ